MMKKITLSFGGYVMKRDENSLSPGALYVRLYDPDHWLTDSIYLEEEEVDQIIRAMEILRNAK